MYVPNKASQMPIPQDIQDVFKTVDQGLTFEFRTATSINELMNGESSIASEVMKGFDVRAQISMVANIKTALLEFLKISDDMKLQMLMGPVMMLAPAFLIQVNANVNIEFDDMDEVINHPMAGPFLASGTQLMEGAIGDRADILKKIEESEHPGKDIVNTLFDLFEDMDNSKDSHVEARLAVPKIGVSAEFVFQSAGLKDLLQLGLMANPGT